MVRNRVKKLLHKILPWRLKRGRPFSAIFERWVTSVRKYISRFLWHLVTSALHPSWWPKFTLPLPLIFQLQAGSNQGTVWMTHTSQHTNCWRWLERGFCSHLVHHKGISLSNFQSCLALLPTKGKLQGTFRKGPVQSLTQNKSVDPAVPHHCFPTSSCLTVVYFISLVVTFIFGLIVSLFLAISSLNHFWDLSPFTSFFRGDPGGTRSHSDDPTCPRECWGVWSW